MIRPLDFRGKQDRFVSNLELGPDFEKPVDDCCSQVASDFSLLSHKVRELTVVLVVNQVLELFKAITLKEDHFFWLKEWFYLVTRCSRL